MENGLDEREGKILVDVLSLLLYLSALAMTLLIYHFLFKREYQSQNARVLVLFVMSLPLAGVAGFRNDVGTDFDNYLVIHQATAAQAWSYFFSWPAVEPAYKFMIKMAAYICDSKEFLFFVTSYITITIAFLAFYRLRNKLNIGMAIVLYYLIAYHPSLNIIRQMLAASILLLMITYLLENNYFCSILFGIIAMLFHKTAVTGLVFIAVVFLFSKYQIDKKTMVYSYNKKVSYSYYIGIICSGIVMPVLPYLVNFIPGFERYTLYLLDKPQFGIGTVANFCFLMLPSIVLLFEFINQDRDLSLLKNIIFLYLPFSIMGYCAPWASRLNVYAVCFFTIYVPILMHKMKHSTELLLREKFLSIYYLGIFLLKYGYEILYLNYHHTFPYFH